MAAIRCNNTMLGRDVSTPLVQLLNLKIRYMCDDKSLIALDTLRNMYALVIDNVKLSRER